MDFAARRVGAERWPIAAFGLPKYRLRERLSREGPGPYPEPLWDDAMALLNQGRTALTLAEIETLSEALVSHVDRFHADLAESQVKALDAQEGGSGTRARQLVAHARLASQARIQNLITALRGLDEGLGKDQVFDVHDRVLIRHRAQPDCVVEGVVMEVPDLVVKVGGNLFQTVADEDAVLLEEPRCERDRRPRG